MPNHHAPPLQEVDDIQASTAAYLDNALQCNPYLTPGPTPWTMESAMINTLSPFDPHPFGQAAGSDTDSLWPALSIDDYFSSSLESSVRVSHYAESILLT